MGRVPRVAVSAVSSYTNTYDDGNIMRWQMTDDRDFS